MSPQRREHELHSKMKIIELTFIFLTLLLPIKGATSISVLLGETFVYQLPDVPHGSSIASVEWIQTNKLLAVIEPNNEPTIFAKGTRIEFMNNGSIIIKDFQREDAGNYTCRIIFQSGATETHTVSLTSYSENEEQFKEWSLDWNSTSAPSVHDPDMNIILQIVTPVSAALCTLLLLGVIITVIFKCRRKRRTPDEAIYNNVVTLKKQCVKKTKKRPTEPKQRKKSSCS